MRRIWSKTHIHTHTSLFSLSPSTILAKKWIFKTRPVQTLTIDLNRVEVKLRERRERAKLGHD